jgi:hypothetical protein
MIVSGTMGGREVGSESVNPLKLDCELNNASGAGYDYWGFSVLISQTVATTLQRPG